MTVPRDEGKTLDRTTPLSAKDFAQLRKPRGARAASMRVSLLFHHRHGVEVVPIGEGQSLSVGRTHPADLVLPDESLSRQHASVELIDGELWVEDLGSTNGTRVDGAVVERAKVPLDAEVLLGAVSVAFRALGADESLGFGLLSHDRFQRSLSAELCRSRDFRRPLALLLIRGRRDRAGAISRWWPKLRRQIHEYDPVALYSDDTIEICLPEVSLTEAVARAEKLLAREPTLHYSVGLYPDHAMSTEALLEVTRTALHACSADADSVQLASTTVPRAACAACAADDESGLVVRSPAMLRVFESARRFADMALPVLIQGETGTGKEVVARAIREAGPRASKPMISVNCGAIPDQLVESTLFGHERGAFTGAHRQAKGVFESAHLGTVFLDEIGELPLQAQTSLLRVLETQRFSRVGSTREIQVDLRVIAATHRDLEQLSTTGEFREDLFYRLDAMAIFVPPLRERVEEIEPLVERFIQNANQANGRAVEGIGDEALALIQRYRWPGNVRELRNAIERAVAIARRALITPEDLPRRVTQLALGARPTEPASSRPSEPRGAIDLRAEVQRFEAELITRALQAADGDRTKAANDLGLAIRTLYYKMKQYGLTS